MLDRGTLEMGRAGQRSQGLSMLGSVLIFIRGGCTSGVALSSVTTTNGIDGDAYLIVFGGCLRSAPAGCLVNCHLGETVHVLGSGGLSVASVTFTIKFDKMDCFTRAFEGGCKYSPDRCQRCGAA